MMYARNLSAACLRGLLVTALMFSSSVLSAEKLIIDTDMGGDVDDVGALAVAHYYADQGQAEILAVMASIDHRGGWASAAADAVNTYYKRPDLLLATNRGPALAFAGDASRFPERIGANSSRYGHDHDQFDVAEDAVAAYRRLLNSQSDQSVTLLVIGWMSNIANLMASNANHGGDGIHKTGKQLLEQKVKRMIVMGGQYPSGAEFNFEFDGASAANVVANLDVPMVFTGYELGTLVQTGDSLVHTPVDNPVREAYRLYGKGVEPFNRASWDLTAVVYAVEGLSDYFSLSTAGTNHVSSNGYNSWQNGGAKRDYYLKLKDSDARYRLRDRLNDILRAAPSDCSLSVALSTSNPSCLTDNGSVQSALSGGRAPYQFSWNNGSNQSSITTLSAGNYSLQVTDSAGCSATASTTLEALAVSASLTHASPGVGGSVALEPSGGEGPYDVLWSNGAKSVSVDNLMVGSYSAHVSDALGCSVEESFVVEERTAFAEVYLEAECAAQLGSDWLEGVSSSASEGRYLTAAEGSYNFGPDGSASTMLAFELSLDESADYQLYAHVLTPHGGADSLWYRVNGGEWVAWHMGVSESFSWKHRSLALPFDAGSNSLEFAFREGGLQLDKLFVTRGSEQPSGLVGAAANCAVLSCPVAGTACDDGNPLTNGDVAGGNCSCTGTVGIGIKQTGIAACGATGLACHIPEEF